MDSEFRLEIRRQAFHATVGIVSIFLILKGFVGVYFFAFLSVFGLILSFISMKHRIPVIYGFLKFFDRKKERIPGKGAILLIVGITLALTFFSTRYLACGNINTRNRRCNLSARAVFREDSLSMEPAQAA